MNVRALSLLLIGSLWAGCASDKTLSDSLDSERIDTATRSWEEPGAEPDPERVPDAEVDAGDAALADAGDGGDADLEDAGDGALDDAGDAALEDAGDAAGDPGDAAPAPAG